MNIIELFSGCGGLAKGMSLAGFRELALVEFNADACRSLRQNFDPKIVWEGDIRDFDYSPFQNVDAIVGGPPCQPFSLGGLAKAHNDARDMFPEAARAIGEVKPRAFLFENVKGLLRPSFRSYFNYIINRLTFPDIRQKPDESWQEHAARLAAIDFDSHSGVKYRVQYRLVNAANYGVPQIRERVIIVGFRSDCPKTWEWPEETHTKATWRTLGEVIADVPRPVRTPPYALWDNILREGARRYAGHTGSPIDQPAKTIKAGAHGVPGGENMIAFPDGSVRYMSVREAKLVQTFPVDYVIMGNWSEAMRQIGNAVPVRLAEAMGKALWKALVDSVPTPHSLPPSSSIPFSATIFGKTLQVSGTRGKRTPTPVSH